MFEKGLVAAVHQVVNVFLVDLAMLKLTCDVLSICCTQCCILQAYMVTCDGLRVAVNVLTVVRVDVVTK